MLKFSFIIILFYNILMAQDTTLVTVESIGNTDSIYSSNSYKVVNAKNDFFIGDNVFKIQNIGQPILVLKDKKFNGIDDFDTITCTQQFASSRFTVIFNNFIVDTLTSDYLPLWANKNGIKGYAVRLMQSGQIEFGIGDGSGAIYNILSKDSIKQGISYYIAVTFDATNIKFYFNGVLSNTELYTLDSPYLPNFTDPFYIGSYGRETSSWLKGSIEELQIYDVCLQPSQLQKFPEYIILYMAIGEENNLGEYPIYYYVLNGVKVYITGAKLVPYRNFNQIKKIPIINKF